MKMLVWIANKVIIMIIVIGAIVTANEFADHTFGRDSLSSQLKKDGAPVVQLKAARRADGAY